MIDGAEGVPLIEVVAPGDYDLATFCRSRGFTVIETTQRAVAPRVPLAVANCVGMVKAVLGVRSTATTPWRLYKHLRSDK